MSVSVIERRFTSFSVYSPVTVLTELSRLMIYLTCDFMHCEACPESKDTSHVGRQGNFYAYCGNTAVDLDPLPVSSARLTVVEPALFE